MIGDTDNGGVCLDSIHAQRGFGERARSQAAAVKPNISILFVDDRDSDAVRVLAALAACRDLEVEIDLVSCPDEARQLWETGIHDLALFDIWLGNGTSIGLMATLAEDAAARPVVILSNLPHAEARMLGSGAGDLLVHSKEDLSPSALALTLNSALALARRVAVVLNA
jgi:DNA-binding NarL/FixJ family response regulator